MKQNKIIKGLAAAAIIGLFFGCASTDDSVKEVVFDSADTDLSEAVDYEEEQVVTDENAVLVETEEESSFLIEANAPVGRENKKNYTGWVATSIRPVTNTVGDVKLYSRPKQGTFAISVLNSSQKSIPVFSTANEYTTTSFYLKAGKKIVKLSDDSSVVSAAKKTAKGIKVRYTVEKVAVVIIDFECIASKEGQNEDTIKITATVLNQSKKKNDFALKLIMDSVLGETDRHHFYLSDGTPVKGEVLYHSMKDEKYFVSKNAKATMQVILDGADITPIESVALANYATLDTRKWEADMTTFRSFDTVLSYNNSAIGIYWPSVKLEPEQEASCVFYISLSAEDNIPGGAAFVQGQVSEVQSDSELPAEAVEEPQETEQKPEENQVQNIQAVKEEDAFKENAVQNSEPEKVEAPVESSKVQNVAAVDENAQSNKPVITDDKLSYDYIQRLLSRIESLEEGDPAVNKDEINALNAELDAIITILNARQN